MNRIICSEQLGLTFYPHFLHKELADSYFEILLTQLEWQIEHYKMFGKIIDSPRKIAWYGHPGLHYCYSGLDHQALPWTKELLDIKNNLEIKLNQRFNSVLANLYRDGQDSMGWHADNEPELGPYPVIASLSLGATRTFSLRNFEKPRQSLKIPLKHGSLILMDGSTQQAWQHAILKTTRCLEPRINLTFRWIESD
jgi:alkylated DNA repair dioxygenase AlkB